MCSINESGYNSCMYCLGLYLELTEMLMKCVRVCDRLLFSLFLDVGMVDLTYISTVSVVTLFHGFYMPQKFCVSLLGNTVACNLLVPHT
jgi:hypothetical protein